MELTPHLEAIRGDLESLVASDEALTAALERMARPIEATLQLRLLDVLGDAALELTEQIPTGHTELRVSGRDARLVFVGAPEAGPEPPTPDDDDGGMARLTVRMPDALKGAIEAAADAAAQSVNAWLVQAARSALNRGADTRRRGGGNRISGYARS
ncbi:MAG TPA: hypothetical protein VGQ50_11660 [Actinomycetota bacterium]|jgi:hypothetical protein|nr:hypothetical protein [Actinomycetota bacterium]